MQGPFSTEINEAMLRQFRVQLSGHQGYRSGRWIPGKDGGLSAAASHVIIGRPLQEEGLSLPETKGISGKNCSALPPVTEGFSCRHRHGCGKNTDPGRKKAFDEAELLIGAKRMTDAVQRPGQMVLHEYRSDKIVEYIKTHPQYRTVAIALSGDVGFYSGAMEADGSSGW